MHLPSPASLTAAASHSTRRMVCCPPPYATAATPGQQAVNSCVLLPGVDRQQLTENAKKLEAAAFEAHLAAQQLNKEGRYEEAKVKYAEMKQLDAEALQITRQLGCQQCMMPDTDSSAAVNQQQQQQEVDAATRALYEQLHEPQPWPHEEEGALHDATQQQGCSLAMRERSLGAIVASLACDAAATGVQWIYDLDELAHLQQQREQQAAAAGAAADSGLEFYDPVQSPFLTGYSSGRNSPYGEQSLVLLQSLAEQHGLDCRHYAQLYYDSYSSADFDGYMNASTVSFLRVYGRGLRPPATGADDAQADGITRLAPLVALFAGDSRLMSLTAAVTRVTQDTPAAVAWACAAAAVLERLVLQGGQEGAAAAVEATAQELRQHGGGGGGAGRMSVVDKQVALEVAVQLERVLQLQHTPHGDAVEQLGRNCHLPNSCQTPLHAVLQYEQQWQQQQQGCESAKDEGATAAAKQRVLVAAVRDALASGGCCASRASFVGACMGALLGVDALPAEWLRKHEAADQVQAWAREVCSCR